MSEFDTGLPSARLLQGYIKEKTEVELKLLNQESLSGIIFWQDPHCICVVDGSEKPTLIWRHALAYIKEKA